VAEENCWVITQARGGHAAADQVPVCWILHFNWTQFYVRRQLTIS